MRKRRTLPNKRPVLAEDAAASAERAKAAGEAEMLGNATSEAPIAAWLLSTSASKKATESDPHAQGARDQDRAHGEPACDPGA